MTSPTQALEKLRAGNQRYLEGANSEVPTEPHQFIPSQKPWAIILSCADSRVPAERVFDQGPGDLFVVRVAGNVASPEVIGSIEFAAHEFGTQLVVVMGHSHCGAVKATLANAREPIEGLSPNIAAIAGHVQPAVDGVLAADGGERDDDQLVAAMVQANVHHGVDVLRNQSAVLKSACEGGDFQIVGAEFSLETGKVDFL